MSKKRQKHRSNLRLNKGILKKELIQKNRSLLKEKALSRRALLFLIVIVCIAVLVTHWPALSTQAMSFDDTQYLVNNNLVKNPSWSSAWRFLSEVLEPSTVKGYYQPLTMISLMFDYALGGRVDNLMPFHRTSLTLHVINAGLLIVLLYLLFDQKWIAAATGLLFGLHPMTVETIPWVGERKTLLAAFFALFSLIMYVCYVRKKSHKYYIGCIVAYVLAVMAKPISLPLPMLMLLLDYWPLKKNRYRTIIEKIPFFVIAGLFAAITYISQDRTCAAILPSEYNSSRIPLILCHNIIFYLYKIIWPVNLSSHYAFPEPLSLSNSMVLAGVIGTSILALILIISVRWTRSLLTGWLFFFLAILPTMQIIGFSNVIAADKYAYLPSFGLLMIVTSFLCWFCYRCSVTRAKVCYVITLIMILTIAGAETIATRQYLVHWRDTESLNKHMLAVTPNASPVQNNMGNVLQSQGKLNEAINYYRQALISNPGNADAHCNLGLAMSVQNKLVEGISHYRQLLQPNPHFFKSHYTPGVHAELNEAIKHFSQALKFAPYSAKAHHGLGILLESKGEFKTAIRHYRQALAVVPDYPEVHYNIGVALTITNQLDEALYHFQEAIRLKSDWPAASIWLARALITHPNSDIRDANKAVELAEYAAKDTGYRNAVILDTLAATYSITEQFTKAVSTEYKALVLSRSSQNSTLTKTINRRLGFYKREKSYYDAIQTKPGGDLY